MIDPVQGIIYTKNQHLNFLPEYKIKVIAEDMAIIPKQSEINVTISTTLKPEDVWLVLSFNVNF